MSRLPFVNLTFIILVWLIVTMQKWPPGTQPSEDDFTEFGESAPEIRGPSVRPDDGYASQISASFTRIAGHFAQFWERGRSSPSGPLKITPLSGRNLRVDYR